jgi:hypothetical protein
LIDYLKVRAERNFRQPAQELAAILKRLEEGDRKQVTQAEEQAQRDLAKQEAEEERAVKLEVIKNPPRGPYPTISGYAGVYRYGNRWQARITRDGQTTRLGTFDDPEEAAQVYDDAARASGQTRRLNFPTGAEKQLVPQEETAETPLAPELQKIKEETDQIIYRQAGAPEDLPAENLPESLRRGLAAHGHNVPAVEDAYEEPELEPAEPDIDPDPAPTPA